MPEDVSPQEDQSSLEKMRSRLYANDAPPQFTAPSLRAHDIIPPTPPTPALAATPEPAWTPPPAPKPKPKKRFSWTVLFFAGAGLFFLVAIGISGFLFLQGGRTVSDSNIIITVQSPTSIASGSVVPLVVTIQNKNPAAISNTDIQLDFPDGTRSADDVTQPLVRYANTLGTIPAGGSVTQTVQAVLFGDVNQTLMIPVTFQYNTTNSNALFNKQQNDTVVISSSPLTITGQSVATIASGQPFTIALTVRSNATTPLTNIAVAAQYPTGFSVQKVQVSAPQSASKTTSQTPADAASSTEPIFTLGTLAPGEERTINITGALSGVENDQQSFEFTVGTANTDGTAGLSEAYASEATDITITKPFLSTSLSLNNSNADPTIPTIVTAGQPISGLVTWINSLTAGLSNAQVSIKLSGNALNPSSVTTSNGFYDSSTNTISFTPQTESSLSLLNPGDTGNGTFSLSTKTGSALNALREPTIQLAVSVSGQPTGGSSETITNSLVDTVDVATDLELASQIVHAVGPFKNSGSVPPLPNQATTYTVELAVTNTVNSVGGAIATMILPSYVTFTGQQNASSGTLTYDDSSRTVTWNIGDVAAGTKPLTAAFQVSFTPSVSQSQTSPILVGNQTLTGTDRFTSTQVGNTASALTTQTPTDPGYNPAFGTVGN